MATVVAPWEHNANVARATRRILAIEKKTATSVVNAVVEVGRLLAEIQDELPYGEWTRWLEGGVHFDVRTASRYMAVEAWARTDPRGFSRARTLSITKVYRLLTLEPRGRKRLLERSVPIPGSDLRLHVKDMTVAHLDRVIRDMRATPPPEDRVTPVLKAAQQRLAGFEAQADALIELHDEVDRDDIIALHTDLVAVTRRLQTAFAIRR